MESKNVNVQQIFVMERNNETPLLFRNYESLYNSGVTGRINVGYQVIDKNTGRPACGYAPLYTNVLGVYKDLVKHTEH